MITMQNVIIKYAPVPSKSPRCCTFRGQFIQREVLLSEPWF